MSVSGCKRQHSVEMRSRRYDASRRTRAVVAIVAAITTCIVVSAQPLDTPDLRNARELHAFVKQFVAALQAVDWSGVATNEQALAAINATLRFKPCSRELDDSIPCINNMEHYDGEHLHIEVSAVKADGIGRPATITLSPITYPSLEWSEALLEDVLGPPSGVGSDGHVGWVLKGGVLRLRDAPLLGMVVPEFIAQPAEDIHVTLEVADAPRLPPIDELQTIISKRACETIPMADFGNTIPFENPYGFVLYGLYPVTRCAAERSATKVVLVGPSRNDLSQRVTLLSIAVPADSSGQDPVFEMARRDLVSLSMPKIAAIIADPKMQQTLLDEGWLSTGNLIITYDTTEPDSNGTAWERVGIWRRNQVSDWANIPRLSSEEIEGTAGVAAIRHQTLEKLTFVDDYRLETDDEGRMTIGRGALRRLIAGRQRAAAQAIIAFVAGHESVHSAQRARHRFQTRTAEDRRLLECQADILGAYTASELAFVFKQASGDLAEAWSALTGVRFLLALSALEHDRDHPSLRQRALAIEFAKAQFVSEHTTDDSIDKIVAQHRYAVTDASADRDAWALRVCKRIMNYHAEAIRDVSIQLKNEQKTDDGFSGELVYQNHGAGAVTVDAHIRLMAQPSLLGLVANELPAVPVDGLLVNFILLPGERRDVPFRLVKLELPLENYVLSYLAYVSPEEGNLLAVEPADEHSKPASAPTAAAGPMKSTCASSANLSDLNTEQSAIGSFLFEAVSYAQDQFRPLMAGPGVPVGDAQLGDAFVHESSLEAPGALRTSIHETKEGATLYAEMADGHVERQQAEEIYQRLRSALVALCAITSFTEKEIATPSFDGHELTISNFSRSTDVGIMLLHHTKTGRTSVSLTVSTSPVSTN